MARAFWLRRHGIPGTLYLGVALNKANANAPDRARMEAHAWLRCGPMIVTGEAGHQLYTVVARFGERGSTEPSGAR